jgi:hypothetical protein
MACATAASLSPRINEPHLLGLRTETVSVRRRSPNARQTPAHVHRASLAPRVLFAATRAASRRRCALARVGAASRMPRFLLPAWCPRRAATSGASPDTASWSGGTCGTRALTTGSSSTRARSCFQHPEAIRAWHRGIVPGSPYSKPQSPSMIAARIVSSARSAHDEQANKCSSRGASSDSSVTMPRWYFSRSSSEICCQAI